MFDIDAASADIRKELYARDFSVQDFIARAERRRLSVTDARADAASNVLDQLASRLRIDPSWLIATAGCLLFVSLNAAAKDLTLFTFPSPEADVGVARILAVATFAAVQQLVGFELRARGCGSRGHRTGAPARSTQSSNWARRSLAWRSRCSSSCQSLA